MSERQVSAQKDETMKQTPHTPPRTPRKPITYSSVGYVTGTTVHPLRMLSGGQGVRRYPGSMDWRRRAETLKEGRGPRERKQITRICWDLHCISHHLAETREVLKGQERRFTRALLQLETVVGEAANGQMSLPGLALVDAHACRMRVLTNAMRREADHG